MDGIRILAVAGLALAGVLPQCSGERLAGPPDRDHPGALTRPAYIGWWGTADQHQFVGFFNGGLFEYRASSYAVASPGCALLLEEFERLWGSYRKTGTVRTEQDMMYFTLESLPADRCARPFVVRGDSLVFRTPDQSVVFARLIRRDPLLLCEDTVEGE